MHHSPANDFEISEYILKNNSGISVKILSLGGIIQEFNVPNRNGVFENIVLSYENPKDYLKDEFFLGALIGRFANRISKSKFQIDGKPYNLDKNEGENHLHGGQIGFHNVNWTIDINNSIENTCLTLKLHSPNDESGYPGNLDISVKYSLSNNNILDIEFFAKSDMDTIFNPTSHSYFNLNPKSNTIIDHVLKLHSKKFLPIHDNFIPRGEFKTTKATPFDFEKGKKIGHDLKKNDEQLKIAKGYDHCFVLNSKSSLAAELSELESGRLIKIFTDQPGIQLYSGNHLNRKFCKNQGLCLETQHFPDSPNIDKFPSTLLKAHDKFYTKTSYHFNIL